MPASLLTDHAEAWDRAIRHPFLDGVRTGSLDPTAFDTWLAQDALFITDLLAFQARLVARAPRGAQRLLAEGVVALVAELDWLEAQAATRGLSLAVQPLPTTAAYAGLLRRLDTSPYPIAVTALWVLERVYLLAWQHAAPGAAAFQPCVQHWTAEGFSSYVDGLAGLADAAGAPDDLVAEVLALETAFWDTALSAAA
jgi:thiaminase/transcriptional activator TenA